MSTAAHSIKILNVSHDNSDIAAFIAFVREGALERERTRTPPFEQIKRAKELRLGALRLPQDKGGWGYSLPELFGFAIDLAQADPSLIHALRNHFCFVEQQLISPHNDDLRWLERVLEGKLIGLGATEIGTPKAGNSSFTKTTLTPDGNGFVLNGTKYYTTGALYSDLIQVRAVTPEGQLRNVVVPTNRAGVDMIDDWDGVGQRLSASGTVKFVDVRVEASEFLALSDIARENTFGAAVPQLFLTAIIAGVLHNVVDDAVAQLKGRSRSFYHAPAENPQEDPILQQLVGDLASTALTAQVLVQNAAAALQAGVDSAQDGAIDAEKALNAKLTVAQAKVVVDKIALDAASALFDAGGASSAVASKQLDRHWRNIRTLASHNPRSYKARAIGQHIISGTPLPAGGFF